MPVGRRSLPPRDAGFTIIEVVVAATIFVVIALAAGAAISSAGSRTAESQTRATATGLADEALSEMRTRRITDPGGYANTRTRTVDGVSYTIRSTANYRFDGMSSSSCSGGSSAPSSLLATATVTSGVAGGTGEARIPPVRMSSIVNIPRKFFTTNSGAIVQQVLGRDGRTPVVGMPVTLSGPSSGTAVTDAFGCAAFGGLTAGSYTVAVDRAGYVGVDGVQRQTRNPTAALNQVSTSSAILYAPPGALGVRFTVAPWSGTTPAASRTGDVRLLNTRLALGYLDFPLSPEASSTNVSNVFPSDTPYGAITGRCPLPSGVSSTPSVVVDPGGSSSLVVPQAPLNVVVSQQTANVLRNVVTGGSRENLTMLVKRTDATGCTPSSISMTTDADGRVERTSGVTTDDDGVPFGTYSVCAQVGTGSSARNVTQTGVVRNGTTRTDQVTITSILFSVGACS